MRNALLVILVLVVAGLAAALFTVAQQSEISTLEIDHDRAAIAARIAEAQSESSKFTGGAIKTFLDLRIGILQDTLAMLDQKRASYIRIIQLNYTINGKAVTEASERDLQNIQDDLSQTEQKIEDAKRETAKYTGGLIQSLALMKVETEELNASFLRLKLYSAKYGIPIQISTPQANSKSPSKPGKVVKDGDAL